MRVHKDGYIECRDLSFSLPANAFRRAKNVGDTRTRSIVREAEEFLGVAIEDVNKAMSRYDPCRDQDIVLLDSNWVRPSRR